MKVDISKIIRVLNLSDTIRDVLCFIKCAIVYLNFIVLGSIVASIKQE